MHSSNYCRLPLPSLHISNESDASGLAALQLRLSTRLLNKSTRRYMYMYVWLREAGHYSKKGCQIKTAGKDWEMLQKLRRGVCVCGGGDKEAIRRKT